MLSPGAFFTPTAKAEYLMTNYALHVPESLFTYARKVAEEEQVSMNQFFVMAIAKKVSALKAETYFRERQARGELNAFETWLSASPDSETMTGDELTWLGVGHNRFLRQLKSDVNSKSYWFINIKNFPNVYLYALGKYLLS